MPDCDGRTPQCKLETLLGRGFILAACAALAAGLISCTELRSGTDFRAVLSDSGQQTSGDASGGLDAVAARDAEPGQDASGFPDAPFFRDADDFSDAEEFPDADEADASDGDAELTDDGTYDAGDTGVPPCAPNAGASCTQTGRCGATIDCAGNCVGGTLAPSCFCNTPVCQLDNTWSACSDPANYGDSCDTTSACGGSIACDGTCEGGSPLPTCQCGTPSCSGCLGGTCGANSVCVDGTCNCTIDQCSSGTTTCFMNALNSCNEDAYGCGAYVSPVSCPFGCVDQTNICSCFPQQGNYCSPGTCFCGCGEFEQPGFYDCDGFCSPDTGCFDVCRQNCPGGPLDPL